jgi:hypothetical protein
MPQSSVARRLAQGEVPTSQTVVYTVGDSARAILSSISFHNSSGADRLVSMWIVPNGGSADSSNKFLETILSDEESYRESGLGQVLEPGDTIILTEDNGTSDVAYYLCGAVLTEV